MTYRQLYTEQETPNAARIVFDFAQPTNGSSAFAANSQLGAGAVLARTGVGTASLTFAQGMPGLKFLYANAHIRLNAVGNTFAQVGGWNATTRVLTINCVTGSGVAAEWPAANANNVLHVTVVFSDSDVKPSR